MIVVIISSQKGGSGKTTLSGHLAVEAVRRKERAVLLDLDPQGSLSAWWNERRSEDITFVNTQLLEVPGTLDAFRDQCDIAIIDTPPAEDTDLSSVYSLADLVLMPVKPSPHDMRSVEKTLAEVRKAGRPYLFVVNEAKPNTSLLVQSLAALSEHGQVARSVIHSRIDFATAMIDGRGIQEISPNNPGTREIGTLYQNIKDKLKG